MEKFWLSGGAVDFSETKDKRAFEIERRTILSQYLQKFNAHLIIHHRKQD